MEMIMDRHAILEELKKVLGPYIKNKELLQNINETTNLIADLRVNSANLVDIVIDAEAKYNIEIDVDSAEKMTTIGSCIDVIQEKLGQPS
jgi:acyl carrier protein